ncbi:ParB/RepB/Spo0J family partition protein [Paraburkholderia humisilvae]|uniref:ParB/RepB/Spo0J family partition protein n=1 Tax=Paraburkholderia humisilvae TaxID=627669 RepID=UPI00360B7C11
MPGRRRALTPEQKIELRENLRHNKLTHPITVRPLPDGRFEVISGHNRTDQYRELRRDKISAVPIEMSDAEASASAFYANLLQSDLSDYEKFVGFQDLLERTGKTQAEIAADSGISENTLSRLMAFVDLPPTAIEIIRTVPHCIGSSAVSQLGAIAREGKADAVLNAVKALAEGRVTQDAAVRMARDGEVRVKATRPTPVSIKSGKTTYCTVIAANKTLRIDFKTEEARAAVEEAVKKILSEFAAGDR